MNRRTDRCPRTGAGFLVALAVAGIIATSSSRIRAQAGDPAEASRIKIPGADSYFKPNYKGMEPKPDASDPNSSHDSPFEIPSRQIIALRANANLAMKAGDFDAAIEQLTFLLDSQQGDTQALSTRCICFKTKGEFGKAFDDIDELIRIHPSFGVYHIHRGDINMRRGRPDLALADFHRAVILAPDYPESYAYRATAYAVRQDYRLAVADLDEAERLGMKAEKFAEGRAYALAALGEHDRAIADYTVAIEAAPQDSYLLFNRGNSHAAKGEYNRAIADFTAYINARPNIVIGYVNRANVHFQKREFEEALADVDACLRLQPDWRPGHMIRGIILEEKGEPDKAKATYTRLGNGTPLSDSIAVDRLMREANKENLPQTIQGLDEIARRRPDSAVIFLARAAIRSRAGDDAGALSDLDRAIQIRPGYCEAHALRAELEMDAGDLSRAMMDAHTAVRLGPRSAAAYLVRSQVFMGKREYERAIADLNRAIELPKRRVAFFIGNLHEEPSSELPPDSFQELAGVGRPPCELYYRRAEAHEKVGDLARALLDADEAVRLSADDRDWRSAAFWLRAIIYKKKGDSESAIADARRSLESAEDDEDRADARKLLEKLGAK